MGENAMTSKEKFKAMAALDSSISIQLDMGDDWYVSWDLEVGGDGMLESDCGSGVTPEAAIDAHWNIVTDLPRGRYLVQHAGDRERRKHFRWIGYMWEELAREKVIS